MFTNRQVEELMKADQIVMSLCQEASEKNNDRVTRRLLTISDKIWELLSIEGGLKK